MNVVARGLMYALDSRGGSGIDICNKQQVRETIQRIEKNNKMHMIYICVRIYIYIYI